MVVVGLVLLVVVLFCVVVVVMVVEVMVEVGTKACGGGKNSVVSLRGASVID